MKTGLRLRGNSVLEINTAGSGAIIMSKNILSDEYGDEEKNFSISEIEGHGGFYWNFSLFHSFEDCFQFLENPPSRNVVSYNRNYISWWLLQKPMYIDDSIKNFLIEKIHFYNSIGFIKKALSECEDEKEINLIRWLDFASIDSNIIRSGKVVHHNFWEFIIVRIYFENFNFINSIEYLNLKVHRDSSLQNLLNSIYSVIKNFVNSYSYSREWILINLNNNNIIKKTAEIDIRKIGDLNLGRLICKKINNI